MAADVVLNGEALELHGNVVATQSDVASMGNLAGFTFYDRKNPNQRYVLYADGGIIRIWDSTKGDILTFRSDIVALQTKFVTFTQVTTESIFINGKYGYLGIRDKSINKNDCYLEFDNHTLSFRENKQVQLTISNKTLKVDKAEIGSITVNNINIGDTMANLLSRVAALEAKVTALQSKIK